MKILVVLLLFCISFAYACQSEAETFLISPISDKNTHIFANESQVTRTKNSANLWLSMYSHIDGNSKEKSWLHRQFFRVNCLKKTYTLLEHNMFDSNGAPIHNLPVLEIVEKYSDPESIGYNVIIFACSTKEERLNEVRNGNFNIVSNEYANKLRELSDEIHNGSAQKE